ASLFANTLSMTSSDVNTIAAVITRDILPVVSPKLQSARASLRVARITTFGFTLLTIVVALQYEKFGGVFGLIVTWFGALIGPIAVPVLFGLLPAFRRCGSTAAIASIAAGLITFVITKNVELNSLALEVSLPLLVSTIVYVIFGFNRTASQPVIKMINNLNQ
ncbi:MAG: Na+:solute symporter, partial [Tunicatimonas sp.]|uniref:sodium:solute symporter family transporter n=1 Tax=Tunicatimonas sp. TaxID=1940096 RepID=UPI003C71C366